MKNHDQTEAWRADLRQRAEARLKSRLPNLETVAPPEVRELLQELQVHRVEPEMQNEQLTRSTPRNQAAVRLAARNNPCWSRVS
jgi:hypothetical protein